MSRIAGSEKQLNPHSGQVIASAQAESRTKRVWIPLSQERMEALRLFQWTQRRDTSKTQNTAKDRSETLFFEIVNHKLPVTSFVFQGFLPFAFLFVFFLAFDAQASKGEDL